MDKLIEKLYVNRLLASLALVVVPIGLWFSVGCDTQAILFWPMFALLFAMTLVAVKLGQMHTNYEAEEFQSWPYRGVMLVLMVIFTTTFYSVWKDMDCEQVSYAAMSGFAGIGMSFYQTFSRYRHILEQ